MSLTEFSAQGKLKRKFEETDVTEAENGENMAMKNNRFPGKLDAVKNQQLPDKKQAAEGFSWWTCLQLDVPLSRTKPQPKKC
ncbi:hypothetical protein ElyMa_005360600 [Elysia marginata]|uniref:Uncharacterized protein n=1 Tax=Elysia marginata TaxID=1093978 RepID=A0AAV4EBV5_9GAST|nr:hypothetical protein ElyMa_005360600 [Elysia marginata]